MSKHTIAGPKGPEGEERPLTARPATDRPPPLRALAEYFGRTCHHSPSRSDVTGAGRRLGYAAPNRWTNQLAHGRPPGGPRHDAGTATDRAHHRSPTHLGGWFS